MGIIGACSLEEVIVFFSEEHNAVGLSTTESRGVNNSNSNEQNQVMAN